MCVRIWATMPKKILKMRNSIYVTAKTSESSEKVDSTKQGL